MDYKRLINRRNLCLENYIRTGDVNFAMEEDSISHFFECEGNKTYETIYKFCVENNFKRIYDIGCAFGHQSEIFLNTDVDYIGVDVSIQEDFFWNKDSFSYIIEQYPFKIDSKPTDIAVSVLCLTWNCYLYNKEDTLREQCEALSRDFNNCLLYLAKDKIDFVLKYFDKAIQIEGNLYYFVKETR